MKKSIGLLFLISAVVLAGFSLMPLSVFATESEKTAIAIRVDGQPLEFFAPETTEYTVWIPWTEEKFPQVESNKGNVLAVPNERKAEVKVTDSLGREVTYTIRFPKMPKLDLFLCIGQSNMAGRAPMDVAQGDLLPIPNVWLFTPGGNWVPATNPLNRFSSTRKQLSMQKINPAYSFAKKLSQKINRPIGLVVNAKGGTSIEEWNKRNRKAPALYAEAMKRASQAKCWGEYQAVLWHQGEANTGKPDAYLPKFQQLANDLRTDLGNKKIFLAVGELGYWMRHGSKENAYGPFNTMLRNIPQSIENCAVISAEGLTPIRGDVTDPHFDRRSQILFGERYADAVLTEVYRQ